MKKILTLALCFSLIFSCAGCGRHTGQNEEVRFYYCVKDPSYSHGDTVIQWEPRAGIQDEPLAVILEFYLAGPQSADLRSPFPEGFRLVASHVEQNTLYLIVSSELCSLSGTELIMACGCLTLTCLDFVSAENVVITPENGLLDGQRSITMNKNTLLLQLGSPEGE